MPNTLLPQSEISELRTAVDRFLAAGRANSQVDLETELLELRKVINALELGFAQRSADFAASLDPNLQESPVAWMRAELHMATMGAVDAITVGQQMEALPQSVAAVTSNRIGYDHLRIMAHTAEALRSSVTASGEFTEDQLLAFALKHDVTHFRKDCAHLRHAADMDAYLTEHVSEVEWRRLRIRECGDGSISLDGFLDSVGGAAVRAALEPLAKPSGADDDRERSRRLADGLIEMANHCLDSGSLPTHGGQRPHLQVTAQLGTLLGTPGSPAGELEGSASPVPTATVQRLACDATVNRVVFGPDSAVIDVGRSHRLPSVHTRRALAARDGGCVWPGCDRSASWTAAHHLKHWAHGGATELENLVLVCHRHHWMIHEGGWQLVRTDEGITTAPPWLNMYDHARAPAA